MSVRGLLGRGLVAIGVMLAIVPAANASDFIPGEVIVRFAPGVSTDARVGLKQAAGVGAAEPLLLPRAQVVETDPGQSVRDAVAALEDSPGVAIAEPNYTETLDAAAPNDPFFGNQWALNNTGQPVLSVIGTPGADLGALSGWDLGRDSADVITAVIDTGIAATHPEFANRLWVNQAEIPDNDVDDDGNGLIDDVRGYDFIGGDADPTDGDSHGTHVAGILGAAGNNGSGISGVSQDATIMPLRACGAGSGCNIAAVSNAIVYANRMGAQVVNMSFGGKTFSELRRAAIASAPGMLFVASAGNEGLEAPAFGNNDVQAKYPCMDDQASGFPPLLNVICVANSNQLDQKSGSSNYGFSSVDLAAPGANIYSTAPQFQYFQSQSFDGVSIPWDANVVGSGGSGTAAKWERKAGIGRDGSAGVTDSLSLDAAGTQVDYQPGSNAILTRTGTGFDLTSLSGCRVDYFLQLDTEQPTPNSLSGADLFYLEAANSASGPWSRLVNGAGNPAGGGWVWARNRDLSGSLHAFDGDPSVFLRFGVKADGDSAVGNGATIDDVRITCARPGTAPVYLYKGGTSMAAPQVSGIASIVRHLNPGLSAPQVKSKILAGVEGLPAFDAGSGSTTPVLTAGRASLPGTFAQLDLTPPEKPSLLKPAAGAKVPKQGTAFTWVAPEADVNYELFLDGTSVARRKGLGSAVPDVELDTGRHDWKVTATDEPGNVISSEVREFTFAPPGRLRILGARPRRGGAMVRAMVSEAGRVKVKVKTRRGRLLADGAKSRRSTGIAKVRVKTTRMGRKLFGSKQRLRAKLTARFRPASGGRAATRKRMVVIDRG